MNPDTTHKIVDYSSRAIVGAAVVAGVVAVMHGDKKAVMYAAVGGAIAGLVGQPISHYLAEAASGLTTKTTLTPVPAATTPKP